jgi:alkylation response protein AidB-like acyl-CoA dehydrogenase
LYISPFSFSSRFGGSEMDAVAAVIAHEELSASDPAFCLSFLAHSMLFANNVQQNANDEQKAKYLPGASSGDLICGMCMSEPGTVAPMQRTLVIYLFLIVTPSCFYVLCACV